MFGCVQKCLELVGCVHMEVVRGIYKCLKDVSIGV